MQQCFEIYDFSSEYINNENNKKRKIMISHSFYKANLCEGQMPPNIGTTLKNTNRKLSCIVSITGLKQKNNLNKKALKVKRKG